MDTDSTPHSVRLRNPVGREDEPEYSAYASGRVGMRPQITVSFRKTDGTTQAFSYSHLYCVSTNNENEGFIAEFTQHRVSVVGRNLSDLFRYINTHRVHLIQEMSDTQTLGLEETQPVVTGISIVALSDIHRV